MVIRDRPLCEDCLEQGLVRPTEELHHVVKIDDDRTKRLEETNVMALCAACHDKRTWRGE